MATLQEVFDKIKEKKKKLSEIKKVYTENLNGLQEYQDIKDQLKKYREKKKQVEATIQEEFSAEFDKMEKIKDDLSSDQEMLNDLAINHLAKGKPIEIVDQYDGEYEPIFSVRFKKVK